jgi:hypothetical protein
MRSLLSQYITKMSRGEFRPAVSGSEIFLFQTDRQPFESNLLECIDVVQKTAFESPTGKPQGGNQHQ